jgi:hypothetical protein
VTLYNSRAAIDIYNQAWEQVALAMHQTIACGIVVTNHAERLTQLLSLSYALTPPLLVDTLLLKRENTHGDRSYLIVTASNELTALGYNIYNIALNKWLKPLADTLNST